MGPQAPKNLDTRLRGYDVGRDFGYLWMGTSYLLEDCSATVLVTRVFYCLVGSYHGLEFLGR